MSMRRIVIGLALLSAGCLGQPFTTAYFVDAGEWSEAAPDRGVPADPAKDSGGAESDAEGGDGGDGSGDAVPAEASSKEAAPEAACFVTSIGQNPYGCNSIVPAPGTRPLVFERIILSTNTCADETTPAQCQCVEMYNCACLLAANVCGDGGTLTCSDDNGPSYLVAVTCN